jgi:hypothetical protein
VSSSTPNRCRAIRRRGQIRRRVPPIGRLRRYDCRQLRPNLLAGCVVAALAVPQALGYAAIAGVPVELGLYAVPLALIAYTVFGTSGQLMVGPLSSVSVMSGSLVAASGRQCGAGRFTTAAAGRTLGQDCAAPDRLGGRVLVQADRDRVSATDREAMKYGGGQICGPRASSS